jgi:hypothetical protein
MRLAESNEGAKFFTTDYFEHDLDMTSRGKIIYRKQPIIPPEPIAANR